MNRTLIITGANEGIGRGIALAFARRGFKLGLISRRKELLEKVAAECKSLGAPDVFIEAVDITEHDSFRASLERLDTSLGGVQIFIANAGMGAPSQVKKDSYEIGKKIMNLNVIAAIDGIEFFKAKMVERGNGTLVGVSSVAGARGLPGAGIYCASKAALGVYLEALRAEIRRHGVQVVDIAPGFVDTKMTQKNNFWMPLLMDPNRAGELFSQDILAGKSNSVAPRIFRLVRYGLKILPNFLYQFLMR